MKKIRSKTSKMFRDSKKKNFTDQKIIFMDSKKFTSFKICSRVLKMVHMFYKNVRRLKNSDDF
jgi:ribosomal protein S18